MDKENRLSVSNFYREGAERHMRMLELKSQIHFLTHHACRRIAFNDAVVEWIDILFENGSGSTYCAEHTHDWYEFNYIVYGEMATAFEGGEMQRMHAGDFIVIPPGIAHAHQYRAENPHEGICLRWRLFPNQPAQDADARTDEMALYDKLRLLNNWPRHPAKDEIGVAALLEQLLSESEAGEQAIIVQMSFMRLLLKLADAVSTAPLIVAPERAVDDLTRRIDIFLQDLQDRELNLQKLADSLHLSYAHMAREFKRRTGKTIIGRMTEIRLSRATELLRSTDLPVGEVAEKSGFASAYYFSRVFKKMYGTSPSAWRAADRSQPFV